VPRLARQGDRTDQAWRVDRHRGLCLAEGGGLWLSGHGLGLAIHERPIISRLVSLDHPMEIKTGMVFALETYCPATDGYSAARIEEEVVVTDKGCRVISLFPAEKMPIANAY
jgi:Xaa-Pro aminopeptidase